MSVYMVIESKVKDSDRYMEYVKQVPAIISKYGGEYIARSNNVMPFLGGTWKPQRMIIIKFESLEKLKACFSSSEYLKIAHIREESALVNAVIVEGI